jgi:ABC-type multidrug transport system fused ATPase/permease subunit
VALGAVTAVVVAAERVVPAVGAVVLSARGLAWALGVGLAGAAVVALRGAVQQYASRDYRLSFSHHLVESCSSRSAMGAANSSPDQIQSSFFTATQSAARLASDLRPTLAGNALAVLLLVPLFVTHGSARAALWLVPLVGVAALVAFGLRRSARAAADAWWHSSKVLFDHVAAMLRGHPEFVASGRAPAHCRQVQGACSDWSDAHFRSERVGALGGRLPTALGIAVLLLVAWVWLREQPALLLAGVSQGLLLGSGVALTASLARALVESGRARRDVEAFTALLDATGPDVTSQPQAPVLPVDGCIQLQGVTYTYPGRGAKASAALEHVTLSWKPGECLAISGANGTGKSTILRLLLRLADPDHGSILVGGQDLRTGELAAWRASVAWLPQRPYLPERATVREAMTLVSGELAEEAMLEALAEMGVLSVLERHSGAEPLATPVEQLSAGERQKVAIARVLARAAPVLLLDEPDAYLDEEGLARLMGAIRARARKQRVLFVAHSARMLGCADRVVDLARVMPLVVQEACA